MVEWIVSRIRLQNHHSWWWYGTDAGLALSIIDGKASVRRFCVLFKLFFITAPTPKCRKSLSDDSDSLSLSGEKCLKNLPWTAPLVLLALSHHFSQSEHNIPISGGILLMVSNEGRKEVLQCLFKEHVQWERCPFPVPFCNCGRMIANFPEIKNLILAQNRWRRVLSKRWWF